MIAVRRKLSTDVMYASTKIRKGGFKTLPYNGRPHGVRPYAYIPHLIMKLHYHNRYRTSYH